MQAPMKAAIAINNVGISLVERGHYDVAAKTFRDAVSVLATVFPIGTPSRCSLSPTDIDNKLIEANRRMAQNTTNFCDRDVQETSLKILTDNGSSLECDQNFWIGLSRHRKVCIRVESSTDFESTNSDSIVYTAIILNNYAVSYKFLACIQQSSAVEYRRLMECSLQLWRLAYSGLVRRTADTANGLYSSPRLLEICSVALHNLVGALIDIEHDLEAKQYVSTLHEIQAYMIRYNNVIGESMIAVASAA